MEIERERHLKRGIGVHASKIYVPVTVKAKGVRPYRARRSILMGIRLSGVFACECFSLRML
jgi:hypothetical protein